MIGAVPLGSWETNTFVAALRHNKMTAPMVTEGAMTGELFLAYVEQCLVPTLRRNDIVVMDNCRVHMAPAVRQAIEKAKASVRYLPRLILIRSSCLTASLRHTCVRSRHEQFRISLARSVRSSHN